MPWTLSARMRLLVKVTESRMPLNARWISSSGCRICWRSFRALSSSQGLSLTKVALSKSITRSCCHGQRPGHDRRDGRGLEPAAHEAGVRSPAGGAAQVEVRVGPVLDESGAVVVEGPEDG